MCGTAGTSVPPEGSASNPVILSSQESKNELEGMDDDLYAWLESLIDEDHSMDEQESDEPSSIQTSSDVDTWSTESWENQSGDESYGSSPSLRSSSD